MTEGTESYEEVGLSLRPEEQEVLAEEVEAFAGTLRDPDSRQRYLRLGAAVQQGLVPPELVGPLETMLELLLQTRRVRLRHGADGDRALHDLFHRTPRGAALQRAAREVNHALRVLSGQTLEQMSLSAAPGRHTLVVATDRCRLSIRLDAAGARIEDLELG